MNELELVLVEAEATASFWAESRDDPERAADEAQAVLAAWAHLRRFRPEDTAGDTWDRLDRLAQQDREILLERLLQRPFLAHWFEDMQALAHCWAAGEDENDTRLGMKARELFDELDEGSLAVYAGRTLLEESHPLHERLRELAEQVERAEESLAKQAHLFLPAAAHAAALLGAYRPDLDEDESLWLTTLKHARLDALAEEFKHVKLAEETVAVAPLTPAEKWGLLNSPRSLGNMARELRGAIALDREATFATAADAGDDAALEAMRAELVAASARVEGAEGLTVGFDFLLSPERRPIGLQVRLRGPTNLRRRFVRAILFLPGRDEADIIDLSAGRGGMRLNGPICEAPRTWRLNLTDETGRVWPVHAE